MHNISLLTQPNNKTCGQTCVAMIAGISVEESIAMFGHDHKTRTKELIRVLRSIGFRTADRLHVAPRKHKRDWAIETHSIMQVRWPNGKGHWVVNKKGWIFDPLGVISTTIEQFESRSGGKITSSLCVWDAK